MIVICAQCLTKFRLDDSKITNKGIKGRCSRCQHIFLIRPALKVEEEVSECVESPFPCQGIRIEPHQAREEMPRPLNAEEMEKERKNEDPLCSYQTTFAEKTVSGGSETVAREKRVEVRTFRIDQNSFRIEWNVLNG